MSKKQNFFLAAAPLFLLLFIDGMGLGLVFPILTSLLMDPNSHFFMGSVSLDTRNLIFGTIISMFMVFWFFGAAFLGDLSDQIGRKKSLIICLVGAFLGYLFSAIGVVWHSITLLILGRAIAGLTAGSQSIAQAAVIDLSDEEQKTRNIGLIIFSNTLGFVLGPMIGGIFSNSNLVSWFNFATPFYVAAVLSLINAVCLILFFKETFRKNGKLRIKLHHALEIFVSAFKHEKVRELARVYLIQMLGWSCFYSFISMFLLRRFAFSNINIDIYMSLMAIGFGIGTSVLVNLFSKFFSLKNSVFITLAAAAIFSLITLITLHPFYLWISVIPIGMMIAISYSMLITLFSNQVDADSQGWVMGITSSIAAFAFGITSFLVSFLADFSIMAPIFIAVLCLGTSAILMKTRTKEINEEKSLDTN